MTRHDSINELRAVHFERELEKAKNSLPMGSSGVFMRVTLGMAFMYLIVVSYSMLGITGPIFVSVLFLVAYSTPVLYRAVQDVMERRRILAERISSGDAAEVQQEA